MKERRVFVRIPEHLQIYYKVLSDIKEKGFITMDVSPGGLRFYVQELVPKGKILEIKICLGNPFFLIKAMVKVIWVKIDAQNNRYELGTKFESIPRDSLERLIWYLESGDR